MAALKAPGALFYAAFLGDERLSCVQPCFQDRHKNRKSRTTDTSNLLEAVFLVTDRMSVNRTPRFSKNEIQLRTVN